MAGIYKSYNRSTLQKFIKSGFVTVNGEVITKPNQQVIVPEGEGGKLDDTVRIVLKVPDTQKNADLTPDIIYEDENVLVVNKPAGLLSEAKGEYCPERTLADYGHVVHRLDRDTSGVMILAKNESVKSFLKKQFQDRKVHKTYYAVVPGELKLQQARIDLPIIRNLRRPTTFLVDANGKPSETFYKVEKYNGRYSLVQLRPTTGRTHQLRVHLNYLGHPIVGDTVYGGEPSKRLMLHASSLEITLPGGKRTTFTVDLPPEFKEMMQSDASK
jgi:RluA family pseudouridine synthase